MFSIGDALWVDTPGGPSGDPPRGHQGDPPGNPLGILRESSRRSSGASSRRSSQGFSGGLPGDGDCNCVGGWVTGTSRHPDSFSMKHAHIQMNPSTCSRCSLQAASDPNRHSKAYVSFVGSVVHWCVTRCQTHVFNLKPCIMVEHQSKPD